MLRLLRLKRDARRDDRACAELRGGNEELATGLRGRRPNGLPSGIQNCARQENGAQKRRTCIGREPLTFDGPERRCRWLRNSSRSIAVVGLLHRCAVRDIHPPATDVAAGDPRVPLSDWGLWDRFDADQHQMLEPERWRQAAQGRRKHANTRVHLKANTTH
jgi:hypothetical protein